MEAIRLSDTTPLKLVAVWYQRMESREKLKHLSDRMLRDIGLTREQVEKEVRKPFWRV